MAELSQSGDLSETSVRDETDIVLCGSAPPRAIISVSKPAMAPDVELLACKADSSLLQAGACLSQPAHKSQFELSQITKVPLALHHTQSLDANQLLNILPPAQLLTSHLFTAQLFQLIHLFTALVFCQAHRNLTHLRAVTLCTKHYRLVHPQGLYRQLSLSRHTSNHTPRLTIKLDL